MAIGSPREIETNPGLTWVDKQAELEVDRWAEQILQDSPEQEVVP